MNKMAVLKIKEEEMDDCGFKPLKILWLVIIHLFDSLWKSLHLLIIFLFKGNKYELSSASGTKPSLRQTKQMLLYFFQFNKDTYVWCLWNSKPNVPIFSPYLSEIALSSTFLFVNPARDLNLQYLNSSMHSLFFYGQIQVLFQLELAPQ